MKKFSLLNLFCIGLMSLFLASSCASVGNLAAANQEDLSGEGQVIFVRPQQYIAWFGSSSPRDYFEVVYNRFSRNEAGMPVVEVGIRYRGGTSWTNWFRKMPKTVELGITCNFYPDINAQAGGPILYSTNRQATLFKLGETVAYKTVCPVKRANGFQVVLGE